MAGGYEVVHFVGRTDFNTAVNRNVNWEVDGGASGDVAEVKAVGSKREVAGAGVDLENGILGIGAAVVGDVEGDGAIASRGELGVADVRDGEFRSAEGKVKLAFPSVIASGAGHEEAHLGVVRDVDIGVEREGIGNRVDLVGSQRRNGGSGADQFDIF